MNKTKRSFFVFLLLLSFILVCFSSFFIQNLSQPLVGYGDTNVWEYIGYYVGENVKFTPFPNLDLTNNQVFYPYGVSSVFQNWGFERDFSYAVLSNLFGYGGWLKIYYILSLMITSLGVFMLLSRDFSAFRAGTVSLVVTFANFNALNRYPGHYGYAVLHWTVLSICADFLIVKRVIERKEVSLRLLSIRIFLLFLSLGQELGYITGFALTSFTVSFVYIVLIILFRSRYSKKSLYHSFRKKIIDYKLEFKNQCYLFSFLLIVIVFLAYLYIPLILKILEESKKFVDLAGGGAWSNPLRLFIPILPDFNIRSIPPILAKTFHGSAEFGDHNPGLFLVIAGFIGLWHSRHKLLMYVPLLTILFIGILYHPIHFPILKIFPWFTFYRISGRITLVEPAILCLFALGINFGHRHNLLKKAVILLLLGLACVETYTAYSWKIGFQKYSPSHNAAFLDPSFFEYMSRVREQPGEAVLDWPFCIIGGNGVGAGEGLCPFYLKNNGTYALRRFHQKKVMGQYFGRLHPSQITSHIEAGWGKLFSPDTPNIFKASKQIRCFTLDQWSFFTDFYTYNDFAGINLYLDLLPDDCPQEFYKRFGDPVVQTVIPFAGRVAFISKSSDLRNQVDLELGAKLKFQLKNK